MTANKLSTFTQPCEGFCCDSLTFSDKAFSVPQDLIEIMGLDGTAVLRGTINHRKGYVRIEVSSRRWVDSYHANELFYHQNGGKLVNIPQPAFLARDGRLVINRLPPELADLDGETCLWIFFDFAKLNEFFIFFRKADRDQYARDAAEKQRRNRDFYGFGEGVGWVLPSLCRLQLDKGKLRYLDLNRPVAARLHVNGRLVKSLMLRRMETARVGAAAVPKRSGLSMHCQIVLSESDRRAADFKPGNPFRYCVDPAENAICIYLEAGYVDYAELISFDEFFDADAEDNASGF